MLEHLFGNQSAQIEIGSIGWEDDDSHYDMGSAGNDGYTLVKVQLFRGRDFTKPLTDRAQGVRILCHINSMYGARIPDKDTRCYVAIPQGMDNVPGAGVIIGTVEKSTPKDQLATDRIVTDYGPNTHVVIKAKSVSIQSYDNEFVSVGTPRSGGTSGVTIQAKDGSGGVVQSGVVSWFVASAGDAKSLMQMTPTSVEIMQKDCGFIRLKSGAITNMSKGAAAYLAPGTIIGPTTVNALPAAMTLAGATISTNVYIGI